MLRRYSWVPCAILCVACAGPDSNSENVGRTEQAVWHGNLSTQANAPGLNDVAGGICSTVLISPRLAITDQHCSAVLPVTNSSGTTNYAVLVHKQSSLWNGVTFPRVTWTWAPADWATSIRARDLRIIGFQDTEAPLTVFPQRIRNFDSPGTYTAGATYNLPVVFMGWGITDTGSYGDLYEQQGYTFGNELALTLSAADPYRKWTSNLGPLQSYIGPDAGDSGGPLFRQLSQTEPKEYELIAVNGGPETNAKGEDPRYSSAELAAMSSTERAAAKAYQIQYNWADLTNSAFIQALYYWAGDTTRPGRLYGEKDYYGPIRVDLDADKDHFYGVGGQRCPMHLYDQRGAYGELTQAGGVDYAPNLGTALPALHAYRALFLNDRTRVYNQALGWGTVVVGSHEANLLDGALIGGRIGTDTDVGKLYAEGRGTLSLADRSRVRSAWWSGINLSAASGSAVANSPEASVMRVPQSRFMGSFPMRTHGVIPTITQIAGAVYSTGLCTSNIFCHAYQSIEPGNTVTLIPGHNYGDLSLKSNSTLILPLGDYFFDGLSTESGSNIVVQAGAAARIWVRESMTLRNNGNIIRVTDPVTGEARVTDVSAAANLFIGYYGTSEASVWELTATLLAPYAKVTLETNRSWATAHAGMVIANYIELHQGNSFYHVPYQCH